MVGTANATRVRTRMRRSGASPAPPRKAAPPPPAIDSTTQLVATAICAAVYRNEGGQCSCAKQARTKTACETMVAAAQRAIEVLDNARMGCR